MNVADWLRALGLERYEAAFRENDVEVGLLPDLPIRNDLQGLDPVVPRRPDLCELPRIFGAARTGIDAVIGPPSAELARTDYPRKFAGASRDIEYSAGRVSGLHRVALFS